MIGSNSDQSNSEQYCDCHCQSYALVSVTLFRNPILSFFSQNVFALVSINFFTIYNMDEPALHNDYVTLPPSFINAINYCYYCKILNQMCNIINEL